MTSAFNYTARAEDGRFVAGTILVESHERALAHLRSRALWVTSLEKSGSPRGAVAGALGSLRWSSGEPAETFFRSLATLLTAGVSLRRSLELCVQQCRDRRYCEALRSVGCDVDAGAGLADAMLRRPREFSATVVAMTRAAETGGVLSETLERVATVLERTRVVRKKVEAALVYPAAVAVAAVLLVCFVLASVVPAFAQMFEQLQVQLPLATRVLIALGRALGEPITWVAAAAMLVFGIGMFAHVRRSPGAGEVIERWSLALPVVGRFRRTAAQARLARTLGVLLRSGVPILSTLEVAGPAIGSATYERSLRDAASDLRGGKALYEAFNGAGIFDHVALALIRVGEESGTLDAMLLKVADRCEGDLENQIALFSSLVEPALIVMLGAVVGTIVASVLIPLYSIIGSIK